MKRTTITLALLAAAAVVGEGHQGSAAPGLLVEAVERGSAAQLADLRAGDVLISWTRSAPSSPVVLARGDFRTPFDAVEVELEHLPRGGVSVVAIRGSTPEEFELRAGAWGLTVRPTFSGVDLEIHTAGRALEKGRATEMLVTWQPLIDRLTASGDSANAAWLLTRVGSAIVATGQAEEAAAVFARAVATCQSNLACEAMVWDAKGRVFHTDSPGASSAIAQKLGVDRARLTAALAAHARAESLRQQLGHTLAAADSLSRRAWVVAWGVQAQVLLDESPDDRAAYEQSGVWMKEAEQAIAKEAPQSLARVRARWRSFVFLNWSASRPSSKLTPEQAETRRRSAIPHLRESLGILETVAPTHTQIRDVLDRLHTFAASTPKEASLIEAEELSRRLVKWAQDASDRSALVMYTTYLGTDLARRGLIPEALSQLEALARIGGNAPRFGDSVVRVARQVRDRGSVDKAISLLEAYLSVPVLTPDDRVSGALALAEMFEERGDGAAAERALLVVLAGIDDSRVEPARRVNLLMRQATLAGNRGDLDAARILAERGLALAEQTGVTGATGAQRLQEHHDLLAWIAWVQGDDEAAKGHLKRAIDLLAAEMQRDPSPSILIQRHAQTRIKLANLSGNLDEAFALSNERLAEATRYARGMLPEATWLSIAAHNLAFRKDYERAASHARDALAIHERLRPGSRDLAESLGLMGRIEAARGNRAAAVQHFTRALDVLDENRSRAGQATTWGSPVDEGLTELYFNAADVFVREGQVGRAVEVVERSRAGAFRDMLAARDLRDAAAVPADLSDLRGRLEAEFDAKRSELEQYSVTADAAAIDAALVERNRIHLQLTDVDRRIAELDPRLAALTRPAAPTLAEGRASLDPGSVLLSYLVGSDFTYLFVITSSSDASTEPGVTVYTLSVKESDLRSRVSAFGRLIEWDDRPTLLASGRKLYDTLVRPAEAHIAKARRVVLSLDGPLHALPFNALVRNRAGTPQYFVHWKPLHTTPSLTVYTETLRTRRPAAVQPSLVAFGDPMLLSTDRTPDDAEVYLLTRSSKVARPLTAARREVAAIAKLFAPHATSYLGDAATEAKVKALPRSTQFVHFAVHGLLNERLPLESALVLTLPEKLSPGQPNGLLQAWEIFQHVRLDADLVTLSACETALGKEVAGEGLVGLTRAFLYAGARTVAASLWKVADGPTAELMTAFYENLRKGQSKDEALRQAQLALINAGRKPGSSVDLSSPAHWAAFTLTGDWK